jgi:hypothetical protein
MSKRESHVENRRAASVVFFRYIAGIVVLLSTSSAPAQLDTEAPPSPWNQWTLAFAPEYFYWQEDVGGAKILDESGFRYGLELSYKQRQDEGWLWAARFKVYYGSIDYDGQTDAGTPVKTTSEYWGGLGELRYGYRWNPDEQLNVDLMGGIGLEDWYRTLNGSGGYSENWLPIYLKAGVDFSSDTPGWFGSLGLKVPVYTIETADLSDFGGGTVTLHPEPRPSSYAEAGYQFTRHVSLAAYLDSYWFGQSPSVNAGLYQVYQPESFSFQAGLKLGWTF